MQQAENDYTTFKIFILLFNLRSNTYLISRNDNWSLIADLLHGEVHSAFSRVLLPKHFYVCLYFTKIICAQTPRGLGRTGTDMRYIVHRPL